jgi:hypothetical protein
MKLRGRREPEGLDGPRGRTALAAFAALATLTGGVAAMVNTQLRDATDVRGSSNTVWLSGEAGGGGRVVLGAIGAERPSVGITIDEKSVGATDVVDLGERVFVHNRETGSVQVLDGRDGARLESFDANKPTDDRAVIVAAGDFAFIVDPERKAARRIEANNLPGPEFVFEDNITDWVGTSDGRLWALDDVEGVVSNFDGKDSNRVRFAEPKSDLLLTAIGAEPVVLDRTSSRLRWLRRSESIEIPTDPHAIVQVPNLSDDAETCVQVFGDGVLGCYSPDGGARTLQLGGGALTGNEVLVATSKNAAVTAPASTTLRVASWESGESAIDERPSPSDRRPIGSVSLGAVLLDDPGSQYAVTIDRLRVVPLDKLSKQTIVLSTDGKAINSVSVTDTDQNTAVEAALPGTADSPAEIDSDGLNDAPIAVGDTAIVRQGQTKVIGVLANDRDPDGDLLLIKSADPTAKPSGTVEIIEKTQIRFTPSPGSSDKVTFNYTIEDPSKLTSTAQVTIKVVDDTFNTDPKLGDDDAKTTQGASLDIEVLANDQDPEGDTLNISAITQPTLGNASAQAGKIRYEPRPDASGTDVFTYTAIDGYGGEATATVTVEITASTGVNLPPIALQDRVSTEAGQSVRVAVLDNDTDPEGAPLTLKSVGPVNGVEATMLSDGAVSLLPANNVSGLISIPYTIEDDQGLSTSSVIGLLVNPRAENQAPIAVDDSPVSPNVAITIAPLANDRDPNNDALVISGFTQPDRGGSVTKLSPTTLRFEPAADQAGKSAVKFKYRISDPEGLESTATITVQVIAPTGSGPVARDDSATIKLGDAAVIDVLANDSHPDNLPFNLSGTPTSSDGDARVNGDSTITFTPPAGKLGTFRFNYSIQDASSRTSSATVSVTVEPVPIKNAAPIASNDTLSAIAGAPPIFLDVLSNDVDPDNDPISIASVGSSTGASISISGGKIKFSSATGGLVTFSYTIEDPDKATSTASVTVQVVEPARFPPTAKPDLFTVTLPSGAVEFNPLTNDNDPEGGALRITAATGPSGLTVSVTADKQAIRVTPPTVSTSTSYSVSYTVTDEQGLTATSTMTIVVDPPPNKAPNAVSDARTIQPIATVIDVLGNDTDEDGGKLTLLSVSSVSPSGSGRVVITGSQVTFTPSGFRGTATFTYTIQDPQGLQDTATVTITIDQCSEQSPSISDDSARAFRSATIDLYANDARTTGTLSFTQPTGGSVTDLGNGKVLFTPSTAIFTGSTSFNYTITNACDDQATATVRISGNRAPNAAGDSATILKNKTVTITVQANDSDPDIGDGDKIALVGVSSLPSHGSANATASGEIKYNPVNGYAGTDSFTYSIRDEAGLTATATVSITIGNTPPVAVPDNSAIVSGAAATVNVIANDTDPDGDALNLVAGSASITSTPAGGTLSVGTGGSLTFTAAATFVGTATVKYSVSDGPASASGTWTIDVRSPNRPPSPKPGYTVTVTAGGASQSIDPVASGDNDPDGDIVSVTGATTTATGLSVVRSGNTITISADAAYGGDGTENVSYTITDGQLTAPGNIAVVVLPFVPPNGPPNISNKSGNLAALGSDTFDLICCGDSDPDGDTLTVTIDGVDGLADVSLSGQTVSVTDTGTTGTIVISFTVSDGNGHTVSKALIITVAGP